MREQRIALLYRVPFVAFIVMLKGGDANPIEAITPLSVGQHVCTLVDPQDSLVRFVPPESILRLNRCAGGTLIIPPPKPD
jgi:hypothetical protein